MANKSLFRSIVGGLIPNADVVNEAGGSAYAFSPEHALAQYAATGCLNGTFYASTDDQLQRVIELTGRVAPRFLAKVAIYAREKGAMKDMPALLCAVLATRDGELLERIFPRVIDTPKMLRNFVQIIRSGVTGRKSLGSRPKRLVRRWLEGRSDVEIFHATIGNDPSMADLLKMVHPRPAGKSREALYGYILGRPYGAGDLPDCVRDYEVFKGQFVPAG